MEADFMCTVVDKKIKPKTFQANIFMRLQKPKSCGRILMNFSLAFGAQLNHLSKNVNCFHKKFYVALAISQNKTLWFYMIFWKLSPAQSS